MYSCKTVWKKETTVDIFFNIIVMMNKKWITLKGLSYYFEPRLKILFKTSQEMSLSWDIDIYLLKRVMAKTDICINEDPQE